MEVSSISTTTQNAGFTADVNAMATLPCVARFIFSTLAKINVGLGLNRTARRVKSRSEANTTAVNQNAKT